MNHNGWLAQLIPGVAPEIWTLIVGTILTVSFSVWYFHKLRKQDPKKAPKGVFLITSIYVNAFYNFAINVTGDKLKKTYPYLFTLFNYILIMSFLSFFGFAPAPASYFFTLTIGLVSFIGIYVVGIGTKGIIQFARQKYANPVEIFSQIAPLLSLSVRLFAASLASVILGQILNIVVSSMVNAPWVTMWPMFSSVWSWGWKFIDVFLTLIQAFVFVMLTAMYWLLEYGPSWDKKVRNEFYKSEQRIKQDRKKQNIKEKQNEKIINNQNI